MDGELITRRKVITENRAYGDSFLDHVDLPARIRVNHRDHGRPGLRAGPARVREPACPVDHGILSGNARFLTTITQPVINGPDGSTRTDFAKALRHQSPPKAPAIDAHVALLILAEDA